MIERVTYIAQQASDTIEGQPFSSLAGMSVGLLAGIPILINATAPSDRIESHIQALQHDNASLTLANVTLAQDAPLAIKGRAEAVLDSRIAKNDTHIRTLQARNPGKGGVGEVITAAGIEIGLAVTGTFVLAAISKRVRSYVMPRYFTYRANRNLRNEV